MVTQSNIDTVQKMYIAYYGRPGDQAGLDYWANQAEQDGGFDRTLLAFANSDEFQRGVGDLSNEDLIHRIYQNSFGRDAGSEGLAFYLGAIESDRLQLANVALEVVNGAKEGTVDFDVVTNRLLVANKAVEAGYENQTILDFVTADPITKDAAIALISQAAQEQIFRENQDGDHIHIGSEIVDTGSISRYSNSNLFESYEPVVYEVYDDYYTENIDISNDSSPWFYDDYDDSATNESSTGLDFGFSDVDVDIDFGFGSDGDDIGVAGQSDNDSLWSSWFG